MERIYTLEGAAGARAAKAHNPSAKRKTSRRAGRPVLKGTLALSPP